jgi:hypothetical protein
MKSRLPANVRTLLFMVRGNASGGNVAGQRGVACNMLKLKSYPKRGYRTATKSRHLLVAVTI